VLVRSRDGLGPEAQTALLRATIPDLAADLDRGVVVSMGAHHLRLRRLPLGHGSAPNQPAGA